MDNLAFCSKLFLHINSKNSERNNQIIQQVCWGLNKQDMWTPISYPWEIWKYIMTEIFKVKKNMKQRVHKLVWDKMRVEAIISS